MTSRDMVAMVVLAAVWGASFLFLHIAAPALGPWVVATGRVSGAALFLLPWAHRNGEWGRLRRQFRPLLLVGVLACALPFAGMSLATRSLPAGMMSILNATTPMWGTLIAWLWLKEPLHRARVLGLALGLGGVVLLSLDHSSTPLAGHAIHPLDVALVLACTLSYALSVHVARRQLRDLSPVGSTVGTLGSTGLILTLPALWLGPPSTSPVAPGHWSAVPIGAWLALAALAILCTGLAYLVFYRLLDRIGANQTLTVTFLIPVFGMLWGALFLDEHITVLMGLSAGIIALGTWLANRPPSTAHRIALGAE